LVGETEVLGENLPQRHFFVHHKIPHDQTRVWTRAAVVESRRLTAWAMARPYAEYAEWCFSRFSSAPLGEYQVNTWNWATATFIRIFSNSLVTKYYLRYFVSGDHVEKFVSYRMSRNIFKWDNNVYEAEFFSNC
jgi:hypothetical protein